MMEIEIRYSKQATKFLARNEPRLVVEEVERSLALCVHRLTGEDVAVDVQRMKGKFFGHYRLRIGGVRVIFTVEFGVIRIVSVEQIGFRGDVYK